MKRQLFVSIAFSVLAANAFAQPISQPVANAAVQEQHLIAEGGSDRTLRNRVAEDGSDHLPQNQNRVAEDGSDHLQQNRVANINSDSNLHEQLSQDGSDRLPQNQV